MQRNTQHATQVTRVLTVDPSSPDPAVIVEAANVLRGGGLVAFPTETVYGLGANALDSGAVARIFEAKGRPATNPIIVHVPDVEGARALAVQWPEAAERLAHRFWPGPLTLVLRKTAVVPDVVTAGGPTVAIRVPAHPVALALVRAVGVPIAAPSANRSTHVSPTTAAHALRGLAGRIDLVLNGGPAQGGLESTVLDVTTTPARLLRPGLVSPSEIEREIGEVDRGADAGTTEDKAPARSPGQMRKHYAPKVPVELVAAGSGSARVRELLEQGARVGWLTFEGRAGVPSSGVAAVALPRDPAGYAAGLYAALHALDDAAVERIIVDAPPRDDEWLAVRDRLERAAG